MNVNERKGFKEQYLECHARGFHSTGKFISFEHHPEMLPICPTKAKRIAEKNIKGFNLVRCGRFGGNCSSAHPGCRRLRGIK